MVESVSSVNSVTQAAAATNVKPVDQEKEQKTEVDKVQTEPKVDKVEKEKEASLLDRTKIDNLVHEYIARLMKENDYPIVQERLKSYIDLFNVDKFMEKYPDIYNEKDLNTIMYNETKDLL